MTSAVSSERTTIPPRYKKGSYSPVRQNIKKMPARATTPMASSRRRAPAVMGANARARGSARARAAPMRRANARESVPS